MEFDRDRLFSMTKPIASRQPVATLYRDAGLGDLRPPRFDLADFIEVLGGLPLVDQPGEA